MYYIYYHHSSLRSHQGRILRGEGRHCPKCVSKLVPTWSLFCGLKLVPCSQFLSSDLFVSMVHPFHENLKVRPPMPPATGNTDYAWNWGVFLDSHDHSYDSVFRKNVVLAFLGAGFHTSWGGFSCLLYFQQQLPSL